MVVVDVADVDVCVDAVFFISLETLDPFEH